MTLIKSVTKKRISDGPLTTLTKSVTKERISDGQLTTLTKSVIENGFGDKPKGPSLYTLTTMIF